MLMLPSLAKGQSSTDYKQGTYVDTATKFTFAVNSSGGAMITGVEEGTVKSGVLVVPQTVTDGTHTGTVTGIESGINGMSSPWPNNGLANNKAITGLSLPSTLETFGPFTFLGCTGLEGDLDLSGTSAKSFGTRAFYGCSGLTGKLTLPNTVTTIASGVFQNCGFTNENLMLPSSITTIASRSFAGCEGITGDLDLSNLTGFTTGGTEMFSGCIGLTGKLTLPPT